MTGGPLNLSLLSRGVGEVHKNGHEKVDVYLEPEDYYNFSTSPERFYLPPIHSAYPPFIDAGSNLTTRSSREAKEYKVPKTFTTRKGALLLFSEDLAQRNMEHAARRRAAAAQAHNHGTGISPASSLNSQLSLKTVEDLANSILKYGSHDRPDDKVYLKFVHARRENFERQIRPGFSAKRYLSTWTRTWDDTVFDNVIKQGYITERSLYHYNLVVPNLRRKLFHEDLSHMPQPYRLMRNMLMMPGSLSGYTFYRVPTSDLIDDCITEEDTKILRRASDHNLRNIRVIKTKGGFQEEVAYSDLDRQSQKDVITDLLVKSAVHYALKKQEEIYEESLIRAVESEQNDEEMVIAAQVAHTFDMKDAVESLLDSQNGHFAIGEGLPEIDDRSHGSDVGGSFKGGFIPAHRKGVQGLHRQGLPGDGTDNQKEFMGGVPVASVRDGSDTSSQHSGVPALPPIRHALSPIKDVSRETTQHITLPPIHRDGKSGEPPTVTIQLATPQNSTLTGASDLNATRGLASRDTEGLPELEEEDRETDTLTGKNEVYTSSEISSDKGKVKTSTEGGTAESVVHPVAGSNSGTGTAGTTKTRTHWKSMRKGPPMEPLPTGILFKPPTLSKPITGLAHLQGHTPLTSLSHDRDSDSSKNPYESGPSSIGSWGFDRDGNPRKLLKKTRKASSQAESIKGSMIMAPDGEIISVGGSVARGPAGFTHDVGNIGDLMAHHRLEGAGTDESGVSDDEPEEWKGGGKKLSISQRSESNKKSFKRGSATGSSMSKGDMDKLSSTGKYLLWDQTARAPEIDYKSGDIDATMSIHSWSYAAREHESELGMTPAVSVPSLPALQLDGDSGSQKSPRSSVTEKDIMDTLTDHAQRIAESVLSHPAAGADLEADVKQAADMWASTHPPRPLSRAASVREFRADAIEEIMRNRRASSAAPSAAEYRNLIKKSLSEAAAKAAGLDPDLITDEAEISPDLLEALASQKLTPDQIEIVSDSDGKTRIQSRVDLTEALGGVEEGHLFIAPGKKGEDGLGKRQMSIPADKVSVMDDMEFDRISYQGTDVMSEKGEKSKSKSKSGSKAGSIGGGTMADLSEMEGMMAALEGRVENAPEEEDDFLKAVEQAEDQGADTEVVAQPASGKTTPSAVEQGAVPAAKEPTPPGSDSGKLTPPILTDIQLSDKKADDMQSQKSGKSGKTGVSQKSEASKDSKKKGKKSPEEKEEPFVVVVTKPEPEVEKKEETPDAPPGKEEEQQKEIIQEKKQITEKQMSPRGVTDKKVTPQGAGDTAPQIKTTAPSTEPVLPPPVEENNGSVDHMNELAKLYGGQLPTTGGPPPKAGSAKGKPKEKKPKREPLPPKKEEKKKKGKKGKKGKKKEEEEAAPPPPVEPKPTEEPPVVIEKEPTPRKPSPLSSEFKPSSPEFKTDESDLEFNFVREQSSPEGDPSGQTKLNIPSPPLDEEEKSEEEVEGDEEESNLKSISNREARAAKRAAAAAKRREEVERRRREKEEQAKREKEETERQVALQREMEEERRRREEERRLRKEQQKENELREQREMEESERRKKLEAERERRAKDEYQRKLEEMRRKQHEEEMRKHELMLQRQREEEERRIAEELLMSQMAEQERLEYERKKKIEEEERKRKELEDKLRRAEEAKKAMEEAQRLAEEMARKQAELEARLKFNRALQEEASGLSHSQEINRAFVFSYFELLQWLGLDIPEFELAKLADY